MARISTIASVALGSVALATASSAPAMPRASATPLHVNAYLCETSQYAVEFATALSQGEELESAKDIVGKAAKREVCGRYIGVASVEEQKTVLSRGVMYRVTALRFYEDNKLAWTAETTFAPAPRSAWHL